MKKYCVILLFFLFVLIISLNNNSYAYVDCNNYIIEPKEVNNDNVSRVVLEYKSLNEVKCSLYNLPKRVSLKSAIVV